MGSWHVCALLVSGKVQCWGWNGDGEVGASATQKEVEGDVTSPADVQGISASAVEIAAGAKSTCALLVTKQIQCWGSGASGQLGSPTPRHCGKSRSPRCSVRPLTVRGLTGWPTALAVGRNHACSIVVTGQVKCWGANEAGQLGNDAAQKCTEPDLNSSKSFPCSFKPLTVQGLLGKATAIAAGDSHTCALLEGGSTQCWGANESRQLGNGTSISSTTPVTVKP